MKEGALIQNLQMLKSYLQGNFIYNFMPINNNLLEIENFLEGQKLIKIYAKLKRRSDISYISERN
jgi:hypothetical protein